MLNFDNPKEKYSLFHKDIYNANFNIFPRTG